MAKTRHVGADFVDALPIDGERRLMLAVLIDAIRTLSMPQPSDVHPHSLRAWLRELNWLQSEDHTYAFSFVNICGALGFDAGYVRRSVLNLPVHARPVRICRYAAKVGESWQRQRAPVSRELQAVRDARLVTLRESTAGAPRARVMVSIDSPVDRVYAAGSM